MRERNLCGSIVADLIMKNSSKPSNSLPVIFIKSFHLKGKIVSFLQFEEFELYWGAVFFLRSVQTFSSFLKSNWSSDFGHAETGNGAKKRVVLRREFFFALILK